VAFSAFGASLHQDADIDVGSLDELAARCVRGIPRADRAAVRVYIEAALAELTAAEIKGVLSRASPDLMFDSRSARALFAAAARLLGEAGSGDGTPPTGSPN
jgi:hypothetical protein